LENGDILVGVVGSQKVIEGIAYRYRPYAKKLEISPLGPLAVFAEGTRWVLLLEYDQIRLASAASMAREK
jgi:hypothetical protein